ncbi:Nicotinate phosphoribosyltransferase 2 [Frankliniella fusca]|uniref:Nicotinate phosphoribosyltransferase 2 n=1 Tax=Frankliniella fusca TaxID=407009 RepID=A0AAE1LNU7_9NEOP|nr:Nicotinate phosphoribosyltransferase 2 [Frankliniella fusca]
MKAAVCCGRQMHDSITRPHSTSISQTTCSCLLPMSRGDIQCLYLQGFAAPPRRDTSLLCRHSFNERMNTLN